MRNKLMWALLGTSILGGAAYVTSVYATPSSGFTSTTIALGRFGEIDANNHQFLTDTSLRGFRDLWLSFQKTQGLSDLYVALTRSTRRDVRRSLWAGTPILTLPVKAQAERLLGVKADTLVYQTYYITSDFRFDLSRWNRGPTWAPCPSRPGRASRGRGRSAGSPSPARSRES